MAKKNPETPFHGVAFVDLRHLLYPGVKHMRGAFIIQPFSEEEVLEKVTWMHTENELMQCLWNFLQLHYTHKKKTYLSCL